MDRLLREAADPATAVILLDVVLAFGAHPDPAAVLVPVLREAKHVAEHAGRYLSVVGSVCGTEEDPQRLSTQEARLGEAGMVLASSNAEAARLAVAIATGGQAFAGAKGVVTYAGEDGGKFKAPVTAAVRLPENPAAAACGDYDTDGWLDLVVGGNGALALLARDEKQQWQNQSYVTGELAYHGGANQPKIVGVASADINSDGRQGVAMLYADRKPMLFFSRGFLFRLGPGTGPGLLRRRGGSHGPGRCRDAKGTFEGLARAGGRTGRRRGAGHEWRPRARPVCRHGGHAPNLEDDMQQRGDEIDTK